MRMSITRGALAGALFLSGIVGAVAQDAPPAKPEKAAVCETCHGPGGAAPLLQYPILAGQTSRYLYLQLKDFNEGRRSDPVMSPMATDLTRDEMRALGNWFAAQKPPVSAFKPDPGKARLGQAKAEETLCTMCHLGGFAGQNEVPKVAGQVYEYIVKQLTDFREHQRTNDAGTMSSVSGTLKDQDIEALGHYLAGL
ncbi:MAG: hypothetical protein RLZZ393_935 [Pseudomonadota bacterium]|jgi:cytochrome c553